MRSDREASLIAPVDPKPDHRRSTSTVRLVGASLKIGFFDAFHTLRGTGRKITGIHLSENPRGLPAPE